MRYEIVLRLVMTELSLRFGFDADRAELDCLSASIPSWRPFPDTVDALRRLETRYRLAVVSNVDDNLFEATAKRLGVSFDAVATAQQARAYKPSPRAFEHAIRKVGAPPERILHVAQSIYHDIVPARALGLATVWVNRRKGREGHGATAPAAGTPDLEVPDLRSLADAMGL